MSRAFCHDTSFLTHFIAYRTHCMESSIPIQFSHLTMYQFHLIKIKLNQNVALCTRVSCKVHTGWLIYFVLGFICASFGTCTSYIYIYIYICLYTGVKQLFQLLACRGINDFPIFLIFIPLNWDISALWRCKKYKPPINGLVTIRTQFGPFHKHHQILMSVCVAHLCCFK